MSATTNGLRSKRPDLNKLLSPDEQRYLAALWRQNGPPNKRTRSQVVVVRKTRDEQIAEVLRVALARIAREQLVEQNKVNKDEVERAKAYLKAFHKTQRM